MSVNGNPQFISATNLHISTVLTTPVESAAMPITGVTNDFDNDTRNVTTPDIGADEGTFIAPVANDVQATMFIDPTNGGTKLAGASFSPQASFTNNGTANQTNVPVRYRICTDGTCTTELYNNTTMIATLNSGATATATFASTSLAAGVYTIKARAELVGDTVSGNDEITGTLNVLNPLSGTYTVGSGGNFPSLTNNGGIFEALNSLGSSSNVTINIISDLMVETGTHALNENALGYSVTIQPSGGAARTISGTSAAALIKLNGADTVTIDGLNTGGNSLAITNSTVGGTVIWVASLGASAGAVNTTIRNTTITGGASTGGNGICVGGATLCAVGADNDNTNITGNTILKVSNGILVAGTTTVSAGGDDMLVINNNIVGPASAGANNIGLNGILISNAISPSLSGNTVRNVVSTASTVSGIGFNIGVIGGTITQSTISNITTSPSSTTAYGIFNGTSCTGSQITRNSVTGIVQTSTSGYPARGIYVNTTVTSSSVTLANNMVSDIFSYSDPSTAFSFQPVGIMIDGTTGGVNVYHNSVNLFGAHPGLTSATLQAAMFVGASVTALDVRNNILSNSYDNSSSATDKNYAIYSNAPASSYTTIDYNDYYASGTASPILGFLGGDQSTIALWRTATGQDVNSLTPVDPLFTSMTNLHLQTSPTISPVVSVGQTIGTIINDFDNDPRPSSAPDIGADEVVQSVVSTFPTGTFYNAILTGGDVLLGNVTITNNLTLTGISDTGASTLTLGCGATVSGGGATSYVIGNFAKQYCTFPQTFTYPVGTTANGSLLVGEEYSPFTASVTALATVPSTLTVNVVDNFFPTGMSPTQSASRYWDVTEAGDLTADISFTYLDISAGYDVNGTETSYNVLRRSGGITTVYPDISNPGGVGSVNAAMNTGTATNVINFSQWGAGMFAPTAAGVNIGGRVVRADGQGISRARVVLTDSSGNSRTSLTSSFGYYNFEDVEAGQTVIVSVAHKQYLFVNPTLVLNVGESITNADFISSETNDLLNSGETYFDNAPFDFDGDSRTDISVWRASNNSWLINRSSDNTWTNQAFGLPTDTLAPADFDGDRKTDYAVFRASEGKWYIWLSTTNKLRVEQFGTATDVPLPTDVDGDGSADLVVWNAGKNAWTVRQSSNGETVEHQFENADKTTVPMVADYDTDGKADLTIFVKSSGTWRILLSSTGETVGIKFGDRNGTAMMGDFDGDSHADLAIYNNGVWTIRRSRTGEILRLENGSGTDTTVVGDYDGDGRLDAAVYQGGKWTLRQSASGFIKIREFGAADDIAIPSVFVK